MRCNICRESSWGGYYRYTVRSTDGEKTLLMAARKRKKSMTANYIIGTDPEGLHRESPTIIGKVRASDMKPVGGGALFTVYDGGCRPGVMLHDLPDEAKVRQELAFVKFGPLTAKHSSFQAVLPLLDEEGNCAVVKPLEPCVFGDLELMLNKACDTECWDELIALHTVDSPGLDFQGRAPVSSHKNVQVAVQGHRQPVMQFGKLAADEFSMDVQHPMSLVQAFGTFLAMVEHGGH